MLLKGTKLTVRNLLHITFTSLFIGVLMGVSVYYYNLHGWQFLIFFSGLLAIHTLQNAYKQYPIDYVHFCTLPLSKTKIFNILIIKNLTGIYLFVSVLAIIMYFTLLYFFNKEIILLMEFIIIIEIYFLFIIMIVLLQFFCRRNKRFLTLSGIGLPLFLLLCLFSKDVLNISCFNIDYLYLSLTLAIVCFFSYIAIRVVFLQYLPKIGVNKSIYIEE